MSNEPALQGFDAELQDFGGAAGNEKGPAQCNNESP